MYSMAVYSWQAEINELNFEEGKEDKLKASKRELGAKVQTLSEKVDTMQAR